MSDGEALYEARPSRLDRVRYATGLARVRHRNIWIACGILVQLVAVAVPVAWVAVRAKHDAVGGVAYRATVLVAAHELLHSSRGPLILVGSAVLFAAGSVVLARPFVHSLATLIVAVPIAAMVGVLVLGVLALVIAVLIALANLGIDDLPGGSGRARARKSSKKPAGR